VSVDGAIKIVEFEKAMKFGFIAPQRLHSALTKVKFGMKEHIVSLLNKSNFSKIGEGGRYGTLRSYKIFTRDSVTSLQ